MGINCTSDFDWDDYGDEVVVPEQAATAVYWNPRKEIVIRQKQAWDEDSDTFITLDPASAAKVAQRILLEVNSRAPAPVSANAGRQKRYREKKRQSHIDEAPAEEGSVLPFAAE
ncbi:MAG: hypothetical protein J0H79_07425 [Alphaproteobacteria bacterium]|nr:hypothetical protein [Alphaproteobacteria bacterium]OJU56979.1 MAG: hypothetical protein BGO00_07420 [Alphaproteobacteria bacterium 62-8]